MTNGIGKIGNLIEERFMQEEVKRKRGGQTGNQNARKHGFYSRALSDAEQRNIEQAASIEGIDEEITILRVKLQSVLVKDPDNLLLVLRAADTLARLLRIKYHLRKSDGNQLKTAIGNVFRDIALPLGVGFKDGSPCILKDNLSQHETYDTERTTYNV